MHRGINSTLIFIILSTILTINCLLKQINHCYNLTQFSLVSTFICLLSEANSLPAGHHLITDTVRGQFPRQPVWRYQSEVVEA